MNTAWVLDLGGDRRMAVAQRQQLQLLHEPQVRAVAFAPAAARNVVLWNRHCVPVLDFGAWVEGVPTPQPGLLGVYAYLDEAQGTHQFAALWLAAPPVRVDVEDSQACELPAGREHWRAFSLSCFLDERFGAVPIVDLAALFEAPRRGDIQ